ncbi:unnamed protein product [Rhodiola kirilowii]
MSDKLQLKKKELTAIRKAARLLRDPGTQPSNTSPLPLKLNHNTAATAVDTSSSNNDAPKKKPVFLYNWKHHHHRRSSLTPKSHHSISNTSVTTPAAAAAACKDSNDTATTTTSSTSNSRHSRPHNSKSDTYIAHRRASVILRCRDRDATALATPSMRRALAARKTTRHRQQKKTSSVSLYQDDTSEDYSASHHFSVASPLLPRLRRNDRSSSSRNEGSSYAYSTPALSTASYNLYRAKNPSNVGSWDATTESVHENDLDRDADDHIGLPGRQGCGIPCYWSKRTPPKYRGAFATCYSPSFSDTLRRKGGSILCGSQTKYCRKIRQPSKRRENPSRPCSDSFDIKDGSSIGTGRSDDELSTNYGELDLEARSRLDGRRWSVSCRSQEGLEIIAVNEDRKGQGTPDSIMSLSNKYRPMFFSDLIGQNIVVQSLSNAISRGRVAPVYLFQGPRGTGKTSTARIFAAALNCIATAESKPCGDCRRCKAYSSGEDKYYVEVDATDKKTIDKNRVSWTTISKESALSTAPYKVIVIDECHLLPSKTWLAFLKFLEDPPKRVVFIFITTDLDCVPRAIVSRCQKYIFSKLKEGDIVTRLRKIVDEENMCVEPDALELIALNADGSLRDAETMLDQLSLLGRKITVSLVHELSGVVSDEKLLELLELAMSSETAETVKKARELMDSGVDPVVLTSQLASLIMDIIAGTYRVIDAVPTDLDLGGRSLTEAELERLKLALKILSEAEKQLRVSSDRATRFTATLLQLGSASSVDLSHSTSNRTQSSKTIEVDPSATSREAYSHRLISSDRFISHKSVSPESFQKAADQSPNHQRKESLLVESPDSKAMRTQLVDGSISGASNDAAALRQVPISKVDSNRLDCIWRRCIEKCHSNTLKQLLHTHGTLISLSENEGLLIACIAFRDVEIKSRAERFLSSIMNSFETVLRCNVEIRVVLLSNGKASVHGMKAADLEDNFLLQQMGRSLDNKWKEKALGSGRADGSCGTQKALEISQGSFNTSSKFLDNSDCSSIGTALKLAEVKAKLSNTKGKKQGAPMQRIESIIREQRLETAWLQAVEKSASGSMNRSRPEKNQVLPQEGIHHSMESSTHGAVPSQELILSGADEAEIPQTDHPSKRSDHHSITPSLLHDKNFTDILSRDNMGYESGPGARGCSGLFCWSSSKLHKQQEKVTQQSPFGSHRNERFVCFGDCCRSKRMSGRDKR